MSFIYYIEINLLCIIMLSLFRSNLLHKSQQLSMDNLIFSALLWADIIFCSMDMIAGICRGQFFFGARTILESSNLIYYESLTIISFLWMLYVNIKLDIIVDLKWNKLLFYMIPCIAFSLIAITNPFTHILFFIDENNLYVRNTGVYFHWVVTWLYFIIPTLQTVHKIIKEKNAQKKKELRPLLYFLIAPFIASIIQMNFYGVSTTQVGVTISLAMIFLIMQNNQILTDPLTKLNNRRSLNNYFDNYLLHNSNKQLFVMLLDLNHFKSINDKFGHMTGDRALKAASDALLRACKEMHNKSFLCRYGGDEFVITGISYGHEEIFTLKNSIINEIAKENQLPDIPYILEFSIGIANGECLNLTDIDILLQHADQEMYKEKTITSFKEKAL